MYVVRIRILVHIVAYVCTDKGINGGDREREIKRERERERERDI
jgi:hypothetical protein